MSTWETRVTERKSRFIVNACERLRAAKSLIDKLSDNRTDKDSLEALYLNFHKLAGPAGIYEMPQVYEHSIPAEDLCRRLIQTAEPASDTDLEQLRDAIEKLLGALNG